MTATRLRGGRVYDPAGGVDGEVRDVYWRDGRIVDAAAVADERCDDIDADGLIVMPGAIDMHTHIGGGKVNIARAMMLEDHLNPDHDSPGERLPDGAARRSGGGRSSPSTLVTGYRYAEMGYSACFEPAVLPCNARQAHMEMADTPLLDTGGYAMLGNDDFLLGLLAENADQQLINDYVAWTLCATQCLGLKVVNPGGINAFKFNARALDVDEAGPHYGVTPRRIVHALARALDELDVPHPLHVHASNLGVPGNFATTLATIDAAAGRPIHLTHLQFHSYGSEGDRRFSSAAAQIAETINRERHVSLDVGQIMFGQTVTCSGDSMHQHANRAHADPRRWTVMDIECDAGCGVVPFRYRSKAFVNALQWAIGLELFLLIDDPWRLALTTDHPNGAPFTSYPHLIRLLMDRSFRNERLAMIHKDAAAASVLGSLTREYSLYEIAILTRAAPARLLGLDDLGRLGAGASADVVTYRPRADGDVEAMFAAPAAVYRRGRQVVRDGKLIALPDRLPKQTHAVKPDYDDAVEKRLRRYFDATQTVRLGNFKISADEMAEQIGSAVVERRCQRRR